jgi:hypothetical protein
VLTPTHEAIFEAIIERVLIQQEGYLRLTPADYNRTLCLDTQLVVLSWPKIPIRSGIIWSARITPLGALSKRRVSDGFHSSENRYTRADAARGSVRERLADLFAARLEDASLHEVSSTHLIH